MDFEQYEKCLSILNDIHPDKGTSSIRQHALSAAGESGHMLDIIVPAYNVEEFIDECIRSILKQKTGYTYRMIIIDDGSKDSTGSLIDKYQDQENVLIIHQRNGGLSAARNAGLDRSDAKYVMFVDSDDCLPANAVEKLLAAAERENADIAAGSYYNFKKYKWIRNKYLQKEGIVTNVQELKGHAWAKVISRSLFEKVQFPEKYWYEDSIMHQIIYPCAARKTGISDIVYQRRNNLNSITHQSAGNPKSLDSLWVTLRLMEDRQLLGMACTDEYYDYLLRQTVLTNTRLNLLEPEIQKCAFLIMSYRINEMIPEHHTGREELKALESAIRDADFDSFCSYLSEQ